MHTVIKTLAVVAAGTLIAANVRAQSAATVGAKDKYTLRLPGGLPFSDFKGYENWHLISSAKTDDRMKVKLSTFTPNKAGTANCGHVCHVAVKSKDYVFHPYQYR